MRIAAELIDEIVAHAQAEAPNEFASPTRYNVHPQDLIRIVNEIEAGGEELVAIYHSHTRSEAYPSQTDVNLAANWPDPIYLICSLAGDGPQVRGFGIRDEAIEEVELVGG